LKAELVLVKMLDALIIILYLLGILAIGAHMRKIKRLSDFFVAGRKVGTLACTATLSATIVGGSATIGMAGLGFKMGLTGAWWILVGAAGLVILAATLGKRVRRLAVYTLPELVGKLYDRRTRLAASSLILIAWLGVIAGQILAAGAILSTLLGWSLVASSIASTSVFIAYTFLGGQRAVVRTDVMQFALMVVGICLLVAPLAIVRAGGLAGLEANLPQGHFAFPTSPKMDGSSVLSLFLLVGLTYVVGPDIYSRLFSAKDERTAKRSALLASFCLVPFALSVVLIGMYARMTAPQIQPDQSIPTVISALLPAGLSGIATAAFLAALMSSADTLLMTTSTIAAWDIYKQHINPEASERKVLRISRGMMVIIGLSALGVALYVGEVINALLLAYAIFSSGLIIPIIAGFYGKKLGVNSNGALAGLIGGGAAAISLKILGISIPDPRVILSMVVCLVLLFAVSKLMPEA
jgi:SSS family solute:Na+ symporter